MTHASADFFTSMRSIAQRENMAVGTLLGKVLPFTEETSSNDQSKVNREVALADAMLNIPEMLALRASAVDIRSMIRVKMADENDFKQVTINNVFLLLFV